MNTERFSLNDVRRITQCSRSNINYWRKMSLISPEFSGNGKTKKVFGYKDLFFVRLIKILKDFHLFSAAPKIVAYLDKIMTGYQEVDYLGKIAQESWCLVLAKQSIEDEEETCYLWHVSKNIKTPEILIQGKSKNETRISGVLGDIQITINISNIAYNVLQKGGTKK